MKLKKTILAATIAASLGAATNANALATLSAGDANEIFFQNVENLYDSNGIRKAPGSTIEIGDHFVGIFNAQNIDTNGTLNWSNVSGDNLSGIFVNRVEHILFPDALDAGNSFPHLVFGGSSVSTFQDDASGTNQFNTGLASNEMFGFYRDATTAYTTQTTIVGDVANATDGNLWFTLGYSAGADGIFGYDATTAADDTGYGYSHANIFGTLDNFTGESFFGMDVVQNNTGLGFTDINDPTEDELGSLISVTGNDFYATSEFQLRFRTLWTWCLCL